MFFFIYAEVCKYVYLESFCRDWILAMDRQGGYSWALSERLITSIHSQGR